MPPSFVFFPKALFNFSRKKKIKGAKESVLSFPWIGFISRSLKLFFYFAQGCSRLSSDLALSTELTADLGAGKDVLTVLVELELGDDDLGRVDAERDGLAGGLVAGDTLNVDDVLETVDGGDLALAALVAAADDGDFVVFADGDGADL